MIGEKSPLSHEFQLSPSSSSSSTFSYNARYINCTNLHYTNELRTSSEKLHFCGSSSSFQNCENESWRLPITKESNSKQLVKVEVICFLKLLKVDLQSFMISWIVPIGIWSECEQALSCPTTCTVEIWKLGWRIWVVFAFWSMFCPSLQVCTFLIHLENCPVFVSTWATNFSMMGAELVFVQSIKL